MALRLPLILVQIYRPELPYTGTVTTAAQNTDGTALLTDYVWVFTTVAPPSPPQVSSTSPSNAEQNVALNKTVSVVFNMPMNPASVTTAFSLKQGNTIINGAGSYNGVTFTFNPDVDLQPGTTYTGTVTTAAKNTGGTSMVSNYVWVFTTVAPAAPQVSSTSPAT